MPTPSAQTTQWHLDRKVPIALIVSLALQSCLGVWWASDLSGRVDRVESDVNVSSTIPERVVRLETQMDSTKELLKSMDKKLDRMNEKLDNRP